MMCNGDPTCPDDHCPGKVWSRSIQDDFEQTQAAVKARKPLPMAVDYLGDEPYTLGQVLVMFIAAVLVIALILSPVIWSAW
jgi:hypothetical protein